MNRYNQIPQSQEVSPFPAGDQKATSVRQDSISDTHTNNKKIHKKKHFIGRENKNLNMFVGANPTSISDMDQDEFGSYACVCKCAIFLSVLSNIILIKVRMKANIRNRYQ